MRRTVSCSPSASCFFFFHAAATTEIYTLSLHDALPIFPIQALEGLVPVRGKRPAEVGLDLRRDRKSTRLNSSHRCTSYAVFCLKKKIASTSNEPIRLFAVSRIVAVVAACASSCDVFSPI